MHQHLHGLTLNTNHHSTFISTFCSSVVMLLALVTNSSFKMTYHTTCFRHVTSLTLSVSMWYVCFQNFGVRNSINGSAAISSFIKLILLRFSATIHSHKLIWHKKCECACMHACTHTHSYMSTVFSMVDMDTLPITVKQHYY